MVRRKLRVDVRSDFVRYTTPAIRVSESSRVSVYTYGYTRYILLHQINSSYIRERKAKAWLFQKKTLVRVARAT